MKSASIELIVKHNHRVNVYPLSATLNSSNEPLGEVSTHSFKMKKWKRKYHILLSYSEAMQLKFDLIKKKKHQFNVLNIKINASKLMIRYIRHKTDFSLSGIFH